MEEDTSWTLERYEFTPSVVVISQQGWMSILLKILKYMACVFNGTKFLTVVISLVEENEVAIAMAPAFRPVCFCTSNCSYL